MQVGVPQIHPAQVDVPQVARSLDVGIASAGLLVAGYALGVVFGGPVLTLLTARADPTQ